MHMFSNNPRLEDTRTPSSLRCLKKKKCFLSVTNGMVKVNIRDIKDKQSPRPRALKNK